jgi:hypothetical protein
MFLGAAVCRPSRFCFTPNTLSIALVGAGVVFVGALSVGAQGQPADMSKQRYLLIHAIKNSSLSQELIEAGARGYGVQFAAADPTGFNIVLKRDDAGPRAYRFIDTAKESTFVAELNRAGSEGFKLEFAKYHNIYALGALVQQSKESRYTYSLATGTDKAKALTDCSKRGCALVAVLNDSLILEEQATSSALAAPHERDYRTLTTIKISTLEKELKEAGAEGFNAIAAGRMMVVMEREAGASAAPVDYRVVASNDSRAAERKLQAAGKEGFRIAVVLDPLDQGVFVLRRAPGTSEGFDYRLVQLQENSITEMLLQAQAYGYRMIAVVSRLAVLERPLSGKSRSN